MNTFKDAFEFHGKQMEMLYGNIKKSQDDAMDTWSRLRESWLTDFYLTEDDVMDDGEKEYVMVESTEENEDGQSLGKMQRIYLPDNLQK